MTLASEMSSRACGCGAVLLAVAAASAGGCASVALRRAVSTSGGVTAATSATNAALVLEGPNEGSFLLRTALGPPARCAPDGGARLDIWCQPLPDGAIARLGRIGAKPSYDSSSSAGDAAAEDADPGCHEETITSLAMSADGQLVATVADDGLRLWQSRTGRPVLRLLLPPGCESNGMVASFSPGGDQLIAAGGCALRRYDITERRSLAPIRFSPLPAAPGAATDAGLSSGTDAATAAEENPFPGPDCDVPGGIALSRRGSLAVVATSRGLLRRFDLSAARELAPIHITEPGPYGVAMGMSRPVVSSDGAWVAVGNYSELYVAAAASGAARLKVLTGWDGLADIDFAPSGTNLAVLTRERLVIVDVSRGQLLHSTPLRRSVHVSGAVRYGDDGALLYVLANERLVAFDGTTAARVAELAREVDDGAYGRFAVASNGLWVHPDTDERMLVRQLPKVH